MTVTTLPFELFFPTFDMPNDMIELTNQETDFDEMIHFHVFIGLDFVGIKTSHSYLSCDV